MHVVVFVYLVAFHLEAYRHIASKHFALLEDAPFAVVVFYAGIDNLISKQFVGLDNYKNVLENSAFQDAAKHTATFSVNGITTTQDFAENASITFPDEPNDILGKTFVGWIETTIDGTTNEVPSFVTSATMGSTDVTYYAVFATAHESDEPVETKAQTLQYDTWSYSGTTSNKNTYRLFGNGSYIESAAFDLSKLSKVIVYGGTYGGGTYNGPAVVSNEYDEEKQMWCMTFDDDVTI